MSSWESESLSYAYNLVIWLIVNFNYFFKGRDKIKTPKSVLLRSELWHIWNIVLKLKSIPNLPLQILWGRFSQIYWMIAKIIEEIKLWYILHHYMNVKCKWNYHDSAFNLQAKEALNTWKLQDIFWSYSIVIVMLICLILIDMRLNMINHKITK